MALLKNIEWADDSKNILVHKFNMGKDQVNRGSALTVREGQVAIFVYKGKLADVFLPGFYKLDTDNMPIITKLLSWKYGFQTPFKADIYFVNTKQFPNQKWGTTNPIMIRDAEFGPVRVRGYGTYSFRVDDAYVFMQNLSGTNSSYKTEDITDYLKSLVVAGISDALAESKIAVLDMAGNLDTLSETLEKKLETDLKEIGVELTKFNLENVSLPEELEKALDENVKMGMLRKNMDVYTQMHTLEAMKNAASNPGEAGGAMGAGMGLSMGMGMANMFNQNMQNMMNANNNNAVNNNGGNATGADTKFCMNCGAKLPQKAKFCSECGEKQ